MLFNSSAFLIAISQIQNSQGRLYQYAVLPKGIPSFYILNRMGVLRLILALSVVASHCGGYRFVGGQIAVQSFFIISGFYMSLILNEKYVGKNNSYKLFITNRFIRLYPIYWVVLVATVLVCLVVAITSHGHSLLRLESYLTVKATAFSLFYVVLTNIIIFGQDVVMFLGINPQDGNLFFTSNFQQVSHPAYKFLFIPQAWTLGIELTFYLVAPFLLRRSALVVTIIILASFSLRIFIYNQLNLKNDPWNYRFFPTEIMFFLLGYLAYKLYLKWTKLPITKTISLAAFCLVVLFSAVYRFLPADQIPYSPFSAREYLYFLTILVTVPILFIFFKKNKLDIQLGELSYPIYIAHLFVAMVFYLTNIDFLHRGFAITVTTLVLSYCLNRTVAMPIEKYRQSRLKH